MKQTYGVVWRRGPTPVARGRLELEGSALRLIGTDGRDVVTEEIRYEDLEGVRVGRRADERIHGRPSLVLERPGQEAISFTSITEPGVIGELTDRITALRRSNASHRAAVVLPLFQGSSDVAARLLRDGPPFDPDALGLERHTVYVTGDEVVFVFEWRGDATFESILAQPGVWDVAAAWTELAAGPPRLAESAYTWTRPASLDESLLPPGLHAAQ
ncbi:MAG TPA: hypothetical protein VGH82_06170 [Gaiellaceae bacterium]|jgi:hypothetical protein